MFDLEDVIRERRSVRMFLRDKPVPRHLVDEALDLAMHAPSNSNVQPWQVVFASGPARDRLVEALLEEAQSKPPVVPQLPPGFAHLRTRTGWVGVRLDGDRATRCRGQTYCGAA